MCRHRSVFVYNVLLLGFLNPAPLERTAANLGLQDLTAAFQWIQDNILFFGGDPEAVTAAGHGSGASCVHWLTPSCIGEPPRMYDG